MNSHLAMLTSAALLGGILYALQSIVDSSECHYKRGSQILFQSMMLAAVLWLTDLALTAQLLEACYQGDSSDSNSQGHRWQKERRSEMIQEALKGIFGAALELFLALQISRVDQVSCR